jgi:predicted molibdopterin-dependent oxidoreductase YjgC
VLLEIARRMKRDLSWRNPREIFLGLAAASAPFEGLTYERIGKEGVNLDLPSTAGAPAP